MLGSNDFLMRLAIVVGAADWLTGRPQLDIAIVAYAQGEAFGSMLKN
jgi:hypothetical protein